MDLSRIAPRGSTAKVSIINTCFLYDIPIHHYMQPVVPGHEHLNVPCYVFLVENEQGRRVLFDLGLRKDWQSLPPSVQAEIEHEHIRIVSEDDVLDSLARQGIQPVDIEALILSHHHFDHIGDPSRFPHTTRLVVGPGFTKFFIPGYPIDANGAILDTDYRGKTIQEISFDDPDQVVEIGPFRGVDLFGDGSLYLLDAPGHSIGHICGLARTTRDPDTFVLLGADACHHNGELRPSNEQPLPATIQPDPWRRPGRTSCPGAHFERWLTRIGRTKEMPFFEIPRAPEYAEFCHDPNRATDTIKSLQQLDGHENVWIITAHDESIQGLVDFFPAHVNQWRERGWRQAAMWGFLKDFHGLVESA